ncbi:hypothetical protein IGI58_003420 [Enterococcus sp. AZ020]
MNNKEIMVNTEQKKGQKEFSHLPGGSICRFQ